jgi:hypothetical protein
MQKIYFQSIDCNYIHKIVFNNSGLFIKHKTIAL